MDLSKFSPQYLNDKRLRPKHLSVNIPQHKKNLCSKQFFYRQTIDQLVLRQKIQSLKPLQDVEVILHQFDNQLDSPHDVSKNQQMDQDANPVQKKIRNILSLPTIRNIKQKAQHIRQQSQRRKKTQLFLLRQVKRKQIVDQFNKMLKGHIKKSKKKPVTLPAI